VMFIAKLLDYQRRLQQAEAQFEMELREKHQIISSLLHHSTGRSHEKVVLISTASLYEVMDEQGRILYRSGDFGNEALPVNVDGIMDFNFGGKRWHALIAPAEGLPYRILVAEQDDFRFRLADSLIVDILKPILIGLFVM